MRGTPLNWPTAKNLIKRRRRSDPHSSVAGEEIGLGIARAKSVCVVSGKGGTGKSLCSASLSRLLARRGRTLLMDADLGVANAHLLQDVQPESTLVDAVEGRVPFRNAITPCGGQLDLMAGGSGYARVAHLSQLELEILASGLKALESEYAYLVVDSAAGLSDQTVSIAAAADLVLLVTTSDLTSLTDAYAFLKVLLQRAPAREIWIVINRVQEAAEAAAAQKRMASVADKFLGQRPHFAAFLPEDRAAFRCTQRRIPVVLGEPESPLAAGLCGLGRQVAESLDLVPAKGLGLTLSQRLS